MDMAVGSRLSLFGLRAILYPRFPGWRLCDVSPENAAMDRKRKNLMDVSTCIYLNQDEGCTRMAAPGTAGFTDYG